MHPLGLTFLANGRILWLDDSPAKAGWAAYRAACFLRCCGDSDLVPALEMVKAQWPRKRLVVYVPSRHPLRGAAVELRSAADRHKTFPQALLKVCQFPAELSDGRGGVIQKPVEW